jgi:ketosteroid isomerase-like protein
MIMSKESEVKEASEKFYAALNKMANGDAGPMSDAWTKSKNATAQHPIGGRTLGRDSVLESFAKVASIAKGGNIAIVDQQIDVGEDMAVETGIEKGNITLAGHTAVIDQRVTNVYRLEKGVWKLQHHHTDLSPAMLDVLAKLNATE